MLNFTLLVIIFMFGVNTLLSALNYKNRNKPIPKNVSDVYDQKDYEQWLAYTMENHRVAMVSRVVNTLLIVLLLVTGAFPVIAKSLEAFTDDTTLQSLLFLAVYGGMLYLANLGFSLYSTFNIEERYGFNTTSPATFIGDQFRMLLLSVVLGGPLLYLIIYLYEVMGSISLVYSWFIILIFSLTMNLLYTRIFIRLFNKLTPLPEGELRYKTTNLAMKLGYEVRKISVMDASKRSTRLNAFFTGFGRFKDIILFDTLVEKCSPDEVTSVLAHEIGHAKNRDVLKNMIVSALQMAFMLWLLSLFLALPDLYSSFGFEGIHYGFVIIVYSIFMEVFSLIVDIPVSAMSRRAEYRADACAAEAGYGDAMISALKLLGKENFANLTPHPLVVTMTYSHPTISQRIEALMTLDH